MTETNDHQPVQVLLAQALADLPAIQKNGTAPGNMGGYKFRRVEDITAALKPLFAKYGIVVMPSVTDRVQTERPTKGGGVMWCVDLRIVFQFIGPGCDSITATVWGQGTDSGDKATQKAVTSAFKTMLSVVFCISDSIDDAEAHDVPETHRPAPAPKVRIDALVDLVGEADIADWVRDQGFPWPWTDAACEAIERKLASLAPPPEPAPDPAEQARVAAQIPHHARAPEPRASTPAQDAVQRAQEAQAAAATAQPTETAETAAEPVSEAGSAALLRPQIEADVEAMTFPEVRAALTVAKRSANGSFKACKERLIESRLKAGTEPI